MLRLQELIAQQMEQQAAEQTPTRKPRRSSSRKDDWLKKGPSKATVVISMGGPDVRPHGWAEIEMGKIEVDKRRSSKRLRVGVMEADRRLSPQAWVGVGRGGNGGVIEVGKRRFP